MFLLSYCQANFFYNFVLLFLIVFKTPNLKGALLTFNNFWYIIQPQCNPLGHHHIFPNMRCSLHINFRNGGTNYILSPLKNIFFMHTHHTHTHTLRERIRFINLAKIQKKPLNNFPPVTHTVCGIHGYRTQTRFGLLLYFIHILFTFILGK